MFPVHKRVDQLKMNHMFNIIQGISPAYLREDILLSDNSNHQTRSVTSPSCEIPRVNSSGLKSFFFTAIKCWNSLPSCVRNIDLKQPFKSMLKKTIWDQMFLENQQSFILFDLILFSNIQYNDSKLNIITYIAKDCTKSR